MTTVCKNRSRWKEITCTGTVPTGRIGHTVAVASTGVVFLWGGVNENAERGSKYLDDLYCYFFDTKEWRPIPLSAPPCGRAFHSAVMKDDIMYIFGGCNGRGRFNQIFAISASGDCQLVPARGEVPATRYCHSAIIHNGQMVIFGGKCGGRNSNKRLADMYAFDFGSGVWSIAEAVGDLPSSRSAHTAVMYGSKMLMFGGRNADGKCCEDLYEYNFDTKMWTRIDCGHHLFMRARHSIVLHNDTLTTFAGWNGRKKLNDLFEYNLATQTFTVLHESDETDPRLPCRRECHTAVVVHNTMLLFGGRFRGLFMNDNYEYELDVLSLRELCRNFILSHSDVIDYRAPRYGLPEGLVAFLTAYERRGLTLSP
eukprot:TRINITY_DN5958_c0_g1_i1.p1 TRINITY_DN5958_c0_g1~~TRINITY_DN5958_c0_g1_i1.p1  ORF type:complete len:368 (-),score=42.38 TRINITY_DN5958_c0_g1_i1:115-1218(-)